MFSRENWGLWSVVIGIIAVLVFWGLVGLGFWGLINLF